MVRNALRTLRLYGIPTKPETGKQHRIEVFSMAFHVPLIGFKGFFLRSAALISTSNHSMHASRHGFDHQLQARCTGRLPATGAAICLSRKPGGRSGINAGAAAYAIHTATGIAHCLQRFYPFPATGRTQPAHHPRLFKLPAGTL